jgi:hypothetical protein
MRIRGFFRSDTQEAQHHSHARPKLVRISALYPLLLEVQTWPTRRCEGFSAKLEVELADIDPGTTRM